MQKAAAVAECATVAVSRQARWFPVPSNSFGMDMTSACIRCVPSRGQISALPRQVLSTFIQLILKYTGHTFMCRVPCKNVFGLEIGFELQHDVCPMELCLPYQSQPLPLVWFHSD